MAIVNGTELYLSLFRINALKQVRCPFGLSQGLCVVFLPDSSECLFEGKSTRYTRFWLGIAHFFNSSIHKLVVMLLFLTLTRRCIVTKSAEALGKSGKPFKKTKYQVGKHDAFHFPSYRTRDEKD